MRRAVLATTTAAVLAVAAIWLYASLGIGGVPRGRIIEIFGPEASGKTTLALHAIASGIMGYYIGQSKFDGMNAWKRGLLYAVLIHGFYDFFLFIGGSFSYLVFPLLICAVKLNSPPLEAASAMLM